MGGIVIVAQDDQGKEVRFSGHADDVGKWMNMELLDLVFAPNMGDSYNGTITIDTCHPMTVIVNTDYFKMSQKGIVFWKALGFRVLVEAKA